MKKKVKSILHETSKSFCVFSITGKFIGEYESAVEIADHFHTKENEVIKAISSETILNRKYYIFKKK